MSASLVVSLAQTIFDYYKQEQVGTIGKNFPAVICERTYRLPLFRYSE